MLSKSTIETCPTRHVVALSEDDTSCSSASNPFDWTCTHLAKPGDTIIVVHIADDANLIADLSDDFKMGTTKVERALESMVLLLVVLDYGVQLPMTWKMQTAELDQQCRSRLKLFPHLKDTALSTHVKLSKCAKTAICDLSTQLSASTLVLGSGKRTTLSSWFLGSTSKYCIQHAQVPAVILTPIKRGHSNEG